MLLLSPPLAAGVAFAAEEAGGGGEAAAAAGAVDVADVLALAVAAAREAETFGGELDLLSRASAQTRSWDGATLNSRSCSNLNVEEKNQHTSTNKHTHEKKAQKKMSKLPPNVKSKFDCPRGQSTSTFPPPQMGRAGRGGDSSRGGVGGRVP